CPGATRSARAQGQFDLLSLARRASWSCATRSVTLCL
ncbi:hypothetical protein A2U01_0082552, partial [Trifolium medium]|nr:hypothetical protein [Trifolium medium]